jgi:hypothetical protein
MSKTIMLGKARAIGATRDGAHDVWTLTKQVKESNGMFGTMVMECRFNGMVDSHRFYYYHADAMGDAVEVMRDSIYADARTEFTHHVYGELDPYNCEESSAKVDAEYTTRLNKWAETHVNVNFCNAMGWGCVGAMDAMEAHWDALCTLLSLEYTH